MALPADRIALPAPMAPRRYRVRWRREDTADTVTLALDPVDRPLDVPLPGQFNMMYAFGVGEVPISVSGEPADGAALLHTIRTVGPVTQRLCSVTEGGMVGLRGPFGTDWDVESAQGGDVVIMAGGIGLAPLRPVVERIRRARDRFGSVSLLVGARSPDLLLYTEELEAWRRDDVHVGVTVDHARSGWDGPVGVVTGLVDGARFDPSRTVAMACGPEVMMRFAARAMIDRGVAPSAVRVSMERNMKCAIGQCGHCQFGPLFICMDGPVFTFDRVEPLMAVREL